MDVSGHSLLAKTSDYGSFTATGMLNFVRGENRTTGDNLYNIMPLNAKLAVVHNLGTGPTPLKNNWLAPRQTCRKSATRLRPAATVC